MNTQGIKEDIYDFFDEDENFISISKITVSATAAFSVLCFDKTYRRVALPIIIIMLSLYLICGAIFMLFRHKKAVKRNKLYGKAIKAFVKEYPYDFITCKPLESYELPDIQKSVVLVAEFPDETKYFVYKDGSIQGPYSLEKALDEQDKMERIV